MFLIAQLIAFQTSFAEQSSSATSSEAEQPSSATSSEAEQPSSATSSEAEQPSSATSLEDEQPSSTTSSEDEQPSSATSSEAKQASPRVDQASREKADASLQLKGLRIRAHFDSALFSAQTESLKQSQLQTFCKSWSDALMIRKGPWGFGIASEVTCAVKDSPHIELTPEMKFFDVWNLIVQKRDLEGREVIEASICRLKDESKATHFDTEAQEVRCEAKRVFPWSDFKVRFVRHRAFVRLIVASLFDQLPFLSAVSKNLVHFDKLRVEGGKEADTYEVSFPPAPSDVIFAEVAFDPYGRRYALRALPEHEAILRAMTQSGSAWIVHKGGRGARFEEFSQRIESAYLALNLIFQLDRMRFEKDRAKNLADKLKKRNYFDLTFRGEGTVGLPLLVMDSGLGGALGAYVQINSGLGVGMKASYEKLHFSLGAVVREKDSVASAANSTQVELTEASLMAYGTMSPKVNWSGWEQFQLTFGPRLGLIKTEGRFLSDSSLPDSDVSIKKQELGVGIVSLLGWTFADTYVLNSLVSYDFGTAIKSATLRTGLEASWILDRLVTQGRDERPPRFKVGLGVHFASLNREFSSAEFGRSFNTKVTLNGLQSNVFVEQTL